MNKFFLNYLIILFSLLSLVSNAQIAGIAATKNVAFSAHPLPANSAEFEPTYNFFRNNTTTDSIALNSNITWRLSYGLTEGLELGLNTRPDFSSSCMAIKYAIYEKEKLSLSLMGGIGLMLGNRTIASDESLIQGYGIGIISTHDFTPKSSIDLNAQYFNNIGSEDSFIFNAEYGVYPFEEDIIFVIGGGYQTTVSSPIVTFNPGFAIETAEQFVLAFNTMITFSGADTHTNPQTYSFGLSVTCLLD